MRTHAEQDYITIQALSIANLTAERDRLAAELETVKSAKANNDKHLDHYYVEVRRLRAENADLVKILCEIGNANEAQVAPVYSELARTALAKVKESAK